MGHITYLARSFGVYAQVIMSPSVIVRGLLLGTTMIKFI